MIMWHFSSSIHYLAEHSNVNIWNWCAMIGKLTFKAKKKKKLHFSIYLVDLVVFDVIGLLYSAPKLQHCCLNIWSLNAKYALVSKWMIHAVLLDQDYLWEGNMTWEGYVCYLWEGNMTWEGFFMIEKNTKAITRGPTII